LDALEFAEKFLHVLSPGATQFLPADVSQINVVQPSAVNREIEFANRYASGSNRQTVPPHLLYMLAALVKLAWQNQCLIRVVDAKRGNGIAFPASLCGSQTNISAIHMEVRESLIKS
jgi:hypothetical protein